MVRVANSVADLVGQTPIVKLNRLVDENSAEVYLKLEYFNPGSSVKDRIALAMIEAAEEQGLIKPGVDTIIEPTSGNTGIGLAMIAAAKGYKAVFVMPETMSLERRNLLRAYGAELVLTPGPAGMKGAIAKAEELVQEHGYFLPQQFKNQANPEVHRRTTGKEIVEQMDQLDAFVSGIGTGGTISGAGSVLREKFPEIKIVAIEPTDSPVLSGGSPGPHKLQGLGAGFIPETLNTDIYDEVIQVGTEEAFAASRRAAREEGILGGISSGAAIHAALEVAKKLGKGKKVLAIIPDNGERYLSTALYQYDAE
ncbi:MAG: cysteine synthase A [Bacillus sp. (in: firmicutes)]|jgi:cysteine synthase|uniref:cysteine synthase A n=1 Tax=unclassified Bacillus (in: firmicutes) TaxID=185979 RepID=UPI001BE909F2|nr:MULTISPECIES: cysteine synthase A [unclassified Bacillus (in: firmicutes)]MBT2699368.1 cysteine synthase A [Bacillus sp. ISL-40]MBT2720111.1 cysteine synthase A [Bacillus sp. ISL-46]MBT2743595.1 cysteine synthase A [Bacillus sp. ISL-77]